MRLEVRRGGQLAAEIDALLIPGTTMRDELFPSFVALPPENPFDSLVEDGGTVLAAADEAGNLLVPFDFSAFVPEPDPAQERAVPTRFVEAMVTGLTIDDPLLIESFTPEGRRLPPIIRDLGGHNFLGTADAPHSVLRVAAGALALPLQLPDPRGPLVIPQVVGRADPRKRADAFTVKVGQRFAVYENRECGPTDVLTYCLDLNGDGDQTDYFLSAFDMTLAQSEPMTIDEADATDFGGYPDTFPPIFLYAFAASDKLVGFRIPEPTFGTGPTVTAHAL